MPSDSRRRKEARNQALFRAVNEKIMGVLGEGAAHSEVLCECGHTSCTRAIPVSIETYREVRSSPRRFVVTPGHEDPAAERVVRRSEAWLVVETFGAAGEEAEQWSGRDGDPR